MFWSHARSYNLNLVAFKKIKIAENMATLGVLKKLKKTLCKFCSRWFFFWAPPPPMGGDLLPNYGDFRTFFTKILLYISVTLQQTGSKNLLLLFQ
jgi:hypothetical protein